MARVFISYSRADLDLARAEYIAKHLESRSIGVWRDKASLHAGEKWPKALGEAIASADAILLIWSMQASHSDYVELEWNIAVAAKVAIVPYLLDGTSLPLTLSPLHAIADGNVDAVVEHVVRALGSTNLSQQRAHQVVKTLDEIQDLPAKEVLETVRVRFEQQGWIVGGSVYQAARDINITYDGPAPQSSDRPWRHRWHLGVGIVVGVLLAAMLTKQLWRLPNVSDSRDTPPLSGIVTDASEHPIEGATVRISGSSLSTFSGRGRYFSFPEIKIAEDQVRLTVEKDGFITLHEYYPLHSDLRVVLRKP